MATARQNLMSLIAILGIGEAVQVGANIVPCP